MRKLFVSLPMNGLSEEEIRKTMAECKKDAERFLGEEFELLDSYVTVEYDTNAKHFGLYYLGLSLKIMARADIVYLAKGWENARGCRVEREAAVEYGLPILDPTADEIVPIIDKIITFDKLINKLKEEE